MFFQLVICVSMWVVGLIINVIRNFPYFYGFPLLSKNSKLKLINNSTPIQKTGFRVQNIGLY